VVNYLFIDGDAIAYMAGFRNEERCYVTYYEDDQHFHNKDWGNITQRDVIRELEVLFDKKIDKNKIEFSMYKNVGPLSHALHSAKLMLNRVIERCLPDGGDFEIYLTSADKSNFRFELATIEPYKGNRKVENKPKQLEEIREYLVDKWNAKVISGMEADDQLTIEHHKHWNDSVVATHDKDLKTSCQRIYDLRKDRHLLLTKEDNLRYFYGQILSGDSGDNIPGLKRWMKPRSCGPKRIEKLLRGLGENEKIYYEKIRAFYIKNVGKEEDIIKLEERVLEIANLLYMRRTENDKWEIPK
jgi:hypothetical protein